MAWIISILLGFAAVLQGGLNKQIMNQHGLATALLFNATIIFLVVIGLWLSVKLLPNQVSSELLGSGAIAMRWWYFIPALCGLSLIGVIPLMIPRIGALQVFLCIMVGQMAFSMIWDFYVEGIPFKVTRLVGTAIALAGLFMASS